MPLVSNTSHPAISVASHLQLKSQHGIFVAPSRKDSDSIYRVTYVQRLPREHLECSSRSSEWGSMRCRIILKYKLAIPVSRDFHTNKRIIGEVVRAYFLDMLEIFLIV